MRINHVITYFVLTIFFWPKFSTSQVEVSSFLQDSAFHPDSPNTKLFMIEFWATWCGPCIAVSNYLEVLQEQFMSELYVVSISEETEGRVQKFLKKHPSKFASVIDYDGQTFERYNVRYLPYAVLLNAQAELIWSGNPANLNSENLKYLISQNQKKFNPKEFINVNPYVMEAVKTNLDEPFELSLSESNLPSGLAVFRGQNFNQIYGSLQQILGYLMQVSPVQIHIPESLNKSYDLKVKHTQDMFSIAEDILSKLDLRIQTSSKKIDVLMMNFDDESKFWNASQFDWGTDSPQYLVDDFQLSADNSTIADFMFKLSELLDTSIYYGQDSLEPLNTNFAKFDWQLHYKFFDLMSDDLKHNFGIQVKKITKESPVFYVEKYKKRGTLGTSILEH